MRALDLVPAYRRGFEAAVGETLRLLADVPAADMCGLSLGGLVALRVAAERRREDDRLTACAAFDRLPANVRRRVRALALAARVMPRTFRWREGSPTRCREGPWRSSRMPATWRTSTTRRRSRLCFERRV